MANTFVQYVCEPPRSNFGIVSRSANGALMQRAARMQQSGPRDGNSIQSRWGRVEHPLPLRTAFITWSRSGL
jgi:hypothetical protein